MRHRGWVSVGISRSPKRAALNGYKETERGLRKQETWSGSSPFPCDVRAETIRSFRQLSALHLTIAGVTVEEAENMMTWARYNSFFHSYKLYIIIALLNDHAQHMRRSP